MKVPILILSILFLLLIFLTNSQGKEVLKHLTFGDAIVDTVTSIYDGDTFRANIKEWPPIVGLKIPIRVAGIDTPEIRGKCQAEKILARQARQITIDALNNAKVIKLQNIKRGKYFRLVAIVMVDDINLGNILINKNLAVAYDGGKKTKNWCD